VRSRGLGVVLALALASPAAAGLDARETAALRRAAWAVDASKLSRDADLALLSGARQADQALSADSLLRIAEALRSDVEVRRRLAEVLRVRRSWRQRPGEHLAFWWQPDQRDAQGLPSRAPTLGEAEGLDAVAAAVAVRFGLEVPQQAPYRIDLAADSPRVFPPEDLRWGVVTPSVVDRAAVGELVLRQAGDLPWLARALALLHGECAGDPACRTRLLEQARRVVVDSGHVPVEDGLRAGVLASVEDPALASALLAVDHLERRVAPGALVRLLGSVTPDDPPQVLRRTFTRLLGESPRQVDREVLRELEEGIARRREEERLRAVDEARRSGSRAR
jgi:hypothetical protein